MLGFTKVSVSSFDLDSFVVSWEIELNPPTRPATDFQFFVERSTAQEGPFDILNSTPLVDVYTFTDLQVNRQSKFRRFFYRIRAVDTTIGPPNETFSIVQAASIQSLTYQQRARLEIVRTERILLSGIGVTGGVIGVKCLVFGRRTFGQRCVDCWDPVKKAVASSKCVRCFSVGFTGGYHSPIMTHVAFTPSTDRPVLGLLGEEQPNRVKAWTSNYPVLSAGDVLIDQENVRWRIQARDSTEAMRVTARQLLELHHITPGDIEYKIPFNITLLAA